MKNKNFTPDLNTVLGSALSVFMFLFTFSIVGNVNAQTADCPLSSNDLVQVSVNDQCTAIITPDMIIEGENENAVCGYAIYTIVDESGVEVGYAEPGNTGNWVLSGNDSYYFDILTATVGFAIDNGNSTMGDLYLEDKIAPTLRCLDTVHVSCAEDLSDYLTKNTDELYSYTGPQEIVNSVGPNFTDFPFQVTGGGGSVTIPFEVKNEASQAEIMNFVQASLSLSTNFGVTVNIQSPTENSPNTLSSPFSDSYFYGKQAVDTYVSGTWNLVITANAGSVQVYSAKLRVKSTNFLQIGNGVIVDDNCHLDDATIDILADYTTPNDDMCGEYFQERKIQYQGTDWRGMKTPICEHVIRWDHKTFADMDWPHNWDGLDNAPLSCTGKFMVEVNGDFSDGLITWDKNGDNYPQPDELDVPSIDGNPIWPNPLYCMINVTYSDEKFDICPGSFKILRKWIAYDMCEAGGDDCCNGDANPITHYQIIKVIDNTPITFETNALNYIEVSADPFDCSATVTLPVPIIQNYGCSEGYVYEVGYCPTGNGIFEYFDNITSKIVNGEKVYTIHDLPVGETCVRYNLTDLCGNQSGGNLSIRVIDDAPPIPICDQHTVVTVTTDCSARVNAETFDDGSFDNCSVVHFQVARMNGNSVGTFRDYVDFFSGDVGKTRQVVLKVTDENDNWNTCMVEVYTDDKIPPQITCPQNVTIDCNDDPHNVNTTGGEPDYWDNCSPSITHFDQGELNQCNEGTITRTWTVTDGVRSNSCTQHIYVQNKNPFVMNSYNWPHDVNNLVGCNNADTNPSNTGEPNLSGDDFCSMVASTYKDRIFNVVDGACYKILRDWTVIDWCQYADNNPVYLGLPGHPYEGMWVYTQVIMVNDYNAPVFTSSCDNQTICAYNADCTGDVNLVAEAEDECTPANELAWSYTVRRPDNSVVKIGNTNTFTKNHMKLGVYFIHWIVEDKCGNLNECDYRFEVNDCKNPTPLCYSEITTVVMPSTDPKMVEVKARDFDRGSTDNCDEGSTCGSCSTDLRFSFSGTDVNDSVKVLTEDQVGIVKLDMWVWDRAGNRDFCTVTLHVQDNTVSSNLIAGLVVTEDDKLLSNVNVTAEDMSVNEAIGTVTDENGFYQFAVAGNSDYILNANMDDSYFNGLTTLDLVIMQKHILDIKKLDSPYKIIAADANNDHKVTASDILALRKLILGNTNKLDNNESWSFVNGSYSFENPSNPWIGNEGMNSIVLTDLIDNKLDNQFIAVKIGDVNNSAIVNSSSSALEPRSMMSLDIDNVNFEANDLVRVPVYGSSFENITGMQFSINFNAEMLDFKNIEAEGLNINESNYSVHDNVVYMSWNSMNGHTFNDDEILFTMEFAAKSAGQLMNQISVVDRISPEAYDNNLDLIGIELNYRNGTNGDFTLFQNTPNPFSNETEIAFEIPEASVVTITVYDVTGKVIMINSEKFDKGYNSVKVSKNDLKGTSGVLYYKVENNGFVAVKKMILLTK